MSLHYLVFLDTWLKYSFIFLELSKFAIFYMIGFYFARESADLLPSRNFWLKFMIILLIFGMIFEGFFLIAYIIKQIAKDDT